MEPVTAALVAAAIQAIAEVVTQLSAGKITDAQAQEYLQASASHFNASKAAWDAAGQKGA